MHRIEQRMTEANAEGAEMSTVDDEMRMTFDARKGSTRDVHAASTRAPFHAARPTSQGQG